MRRSSTHKQAILAIALFVGLYVYESVASLTIWLPPLIGVCLMYFIRFDREERFYSFVAVLCAIALIESENNIPLGSLLILFFFLSSLVMPRISAVLNTPRIAKTTCVVLAYVSFYIVALAVGYVLGDTFAPSVWMIAYYIVIEMVLVIFL